MHIHIDDVVEILAELMEEETTLASSTSELLNTIESQDDYFMSCEESGQGINTKDSAKMKSAMVDYIKAVRGLSPIVSLRDSLKSETAKTVLFRALDEAIPGFRELFKA
jgi:hypothetical protein